MQMLNKSSFIGIGLFFICFILLTGCVTTDEKQNENEPQERILLGITPQEAYDLIQDNEHNEDFIIIDVRTLTEFQSGHLQDAILIDFYQDTFREELDELEKDKTYLIYCRTGRRTGETMVIMEELGFSHVYNMLDGITEWNNLGLPIDYT